MKILNVTAMLVILAFTSCCTSNKTTSTNETIADKANAKQKMMEDGFTQGIIVASTAENDCPYVIKSDVDGTMVMYDPTNLEENYKQDGMKVWYKYQPLRMMNRCDKANPVSITEIKAM